MKIGIIVYAFRRISAKVQFAGERFVPQGNMKDHYVALFLPVPVLLLGGKMRGKVWWKVGFLLSLRGSIYCIGALCFLLFSSSFFVNGNILSSSFFPLSASHEKFGGNFSLEI